MLLEPCIEQNRCVDLCEEEIIAWRIETYRRDLESMYELATPVLAEFGNVEDRVLRAPSGRICAPGSCGYRTREDVMAHYTKREQEQQERKARSM